MFSAFCLRQCRPFADVLLAQNLSHVDLLWVGTRQAQPRALARLLDRIPSDLSVDVVVLANQWGDVGRPPCFRANPRRFPFFTRGWALHHVLGMWRRVSGWVAVKCGVRGLLMEMGLLKYITLYQHRRPGLYYTTEAQEVERARKWTQKKSIATTSSEVIKR